MNYFFIFLISYFLMGHLFAPISNTYTSPQINTKLYTEEGEYVLTPEDYGYSPNLIISLWGAGSGSSYSLGYKTQGEKTIYCPGNSGSYVNFNIQTNNNTFYFSLGAGGYSSLISDTWAQDGNYSEFWTMSSDSVKHTIAFASGGYANGTHSGGVVYNCYAWDNIPNGGYGAHSPYGHEGGNFNGTPKCDGFMGSGSGYNCCYCMVDNHNVCIRPYKGGDGALLMYYIA